MAVDCSLSQILADTQGWVRDDFALATRDEVVSLEDEGGFDLNQLLAEIDRQVIGVSLRKVPVVRTGREDCNNPFLEGLKEMGANLTQVGSLCDRELTFFSLRPQRISYRVIKIRSTKPKLDL